MLRLTNLTRVKRLLTIDNSGHDTLLQQLITEVSARIERFLGRHVEKLARTVQIDIEDGQQVVFLKGYPVEATPAAQFRNDSAREFSGSDIDTDDYFLRREDGSATFDSIALIPGDGVFRAVYTGGLAWTLDRLQMTLTGAAGDFTVGTAVTGGTSGATGTIVSWATPTLVLSVDAFGAFLSSEPVSAASGGTATISSLDRIPLVTAYADLVQAAETQIAFEYQRRQNIGVKSISIEGASYSIDPSTQLLAGVVEILRPLRAWVRRTED